MDHDGWANGAIQQAIDQIKPIEVMGRDVIRAAAEL
jgi:hypothetical protein